MTLAALGLLPIDPAHAASIAARYAEGVVHGFLVLRTLDGRELADGELLQFAHGNEVTNRLVFRFRDGSLHEETAVFTQRGRFRLLNDHLVQKGPAFPHSIDMTIDVRKGRARVRYTDDDGKEKIENEDELEPDLANGMLFTLLKNIRPEEGTTTVSFLAVTPKPRTVKLDIVHAGEDALSLGNTKVVASRYVVKLSGAAAIVAPLISGKTTDLNVWVVRGEAPGFVRSEGALYAGGPIWRIELASPVLR